MAVAADDETAVADYHAWTKLLDRAVKEAAATLREPEHCLPFLQAGRLLRVVGESAVFQAGQPAGGAGLEDGEDGEGTPDGGDFGWGVLVAVRKHGSAGADGM